MAKVATAGRARWRIELLALFALLLNASLPQVVLRALPMADLFASAICHGGGAPVDPAQQAPTTSKALCPLCILVAGQVIGLPTGAAPSLLPTPSLHGLALARAPPEAAPRPALPIIHPARGPPSLA
jgi:hypothetical protein